MFELVPFKMEHITPVLDQKINQGVKAFFLAQGKRYEDPKLGMTGMFHGKPIVFGGFEPIWDNRGMVWCVFSNEEKKHFVPVFRGIKKFLLQTPYVRTEVYIPFDFEQGKRRAEMLGFKLECARAPKFLPNGTDCAIYCLIKGDE